MILIHVEHNVNKENNFFLTSPSYSEKAVWPSQSVSHTNRVIDNYLAHPEFFVREEKSQAFPSP